MSSIKNRINLLIEKLDVSKNQFAKEIGTSSAMISKITTKEINFGVDIAEKIISTYPRINPVWLLTGVGEIFINATNNNTQVNTQVDTQVAKNNARESRIQTEKKAGANGGTRKRYTFSDPEFYQQSNTPEEQIILAEYGAKMIRKTEMLLKYGEKFKFELESSDPELYKLRQETDNFMYRVTALYSFHLKYLMKFSLLKITQEIDSNISDPDNYSYQEYKRDVYVSLEAIKKSEDLINEGNERLKDILKYLKNFDANDVIEGYLLK